MGLAFQVILNVLGGLGIFLLGMNNMSNGLQTIAGDRLRKLISKVTNNRVMAVIIGTLVTTIIQSSSITTVMVVGFVNATIMNLTQAIGVIMGANIGTTITGWILVVKIGKYGLPMLGAAAIVFLFCKKDNIKFTAMAIMGLGMVFFGLELMTKGFAPINKIPAFVQMFHTFSADTYFGVFKCILTGALLTMIVQSSSATLGITIGLASTGIIPFETAAALVLGENIGTTITAFLASFGTKTNARRAAYAHIIFNVLGVCWIFLLFPVYLKIIREFVIHNDPNTIRETVEGIKTYPYITAAIAAVHTGFNIANVIVFLPFVNYLAKFLEKIVPEKKEELKPQLTHLDLRMIETPVILVEQSKREILNMGVIVNEMMASLKDSLLNDYNSKNPIARSIFEKEEDMDIIQKEISNVLVEVLTQDLPHALTLEIKNYITFSDEYESISDYITHILKLNLKLNEQELYLSEQKKQDLMSMHDVVLEYFNFVNDALKKGKTNIEKDVYEKNMNITKHFKELRSKHFERMEQNKMDPYLSNIYMDILNSYRRLKAYTFHLGEILIGAS